MNMRRSCGLAALGAGLFCLASCGPARPPAQEDAGPPQADTPATAEALPQPAAAAVASRPATDRPDPRRAALQALARPIAVEFQETPLRDALEELAGHAGLNLWIDEEELMEEGVSLTDRVDERADGLPARFVLDRILEPRGLAWIIDGGVLEITSETSAEERLVSRACDLRFLLAAADDPDMLADTLLLETSGPWQEIEGAGGVFAIVGDVLLVRHNRRVHEEVRGLLDGLSAALAGDAPRGEIAVRPPGYPFAADESVRAALAGPVEVSFAGTSLKEAIAEVARASGVPIQIDVVGLAEQGIKIDAKVRAKFSGLPAREALTRLLDPLRCTWLIREGRVLVTSRMAAAEALVTVVHDVRDLAEEGYSSDALIDAIVQTAGGPWKDIDGHGGTLSIPVQGGLVVRNTDRGHAEVTHALEEIRDVLRRRAKSPRHDPDEIVVEVHRLSLPGIRGSEAVEAVRTFVAPETWRDGPQGGRIRAVGDMLVVEHRRQVQEDIADFLRQLAPKKPLPSRLLEDPEDSLRSPMLDAEPPPAAEPSR